MSLQDGHDMVQQKAEHLQKQVGLIGGFAEQQKKGNRDCSPLCLCPGLGARQPFSLRRENQDTHTMSVGRCVAAVVAAS